MGKSSKYVAREPDATGFVRYTEEDNAIWAELYDRQWRAIQGKACDEFIEGLEKLKLPRDRVPQLEDVSRVLRRETGWEVAAVPALIPFSQFFELLANRRFPAATFVRTREELDYLQEPDVFHEIFGHTPLLTNRYFAEFTQTYGQLGLAASKEDRVFLARMYWFTVEFGLIRAPGVPLRIYGGGILSSIGETEYALSDRPRRKRFDILDALRTPYRIDIMQPLYYVIGELRELFDLARTDIMAKVDEARRLGLHPPLFPPKTETPAPVRSPKEQAAKE
ncbi:MAG: phenylalanine 4-monooxygenase, partial [Gammaproteobacteria bacterium]|nr:phenylalanine 4-monooxygenase [Gammaproteobacteria bacterium]